VVGDGVAPTGFARVLHSLLDRLKDRWEFHHLALNYISGPHPLDWEVYAAGEHGDYFGVNRIQEMVKKVQPQLVFLLNDPWILVRYMDPLEEFRKSLKVVAYTPVDACCVELPFVGALHRLDSLVFYTEFGRREIEASFAEIRRSQPELPFPRVDVIPHGVDTGVFHPWPSENGVSGRVRARQGLLPGPDHFADDFIVLNANRNQPRKRIDLTIMGFAQFARDKPPGVRLYLHMGVEDVGWNVVVLARRYGIEDRLILTSDAANLPAVDDPMLNRIYNACDVGINTSIGEGWGLINVEHAAAGAAQIVPRHSACEEIWQGSALLMEPAFSIVTERILTECRIVSPAEVAQALESLYRDSHHLAAMSAAALGVATRPEYQWSYLAEQWDALWRDILESA
jgi:D-inositol-3-phosphate glycosyltransferase